VPSDLLIFGLAAGAGQYWEAAGQYSGSGKTGLYSWLKRRATSRVSSMCDIWSLPTGTTSPRTIKMSAACRTG